jgi:hypothetical protein
MKRPSRLYLRALSILLPTLILGLVIPFNAAQAAVPIETPTFSNPLNINNAFFSFQPGRKKFYTGSEPGTKTAAIDTYLTATRTFRLNGKKVACRILVEEAYADAVLVETSLNYFAQADDGTVYYFGEVVNIYHTNGDITHEGSWLVGGWALRSDPPAIGYAAQPAVFMPAKPELDDVFKPEDVVGVAEETDEIVGVDLDVVVPAGKYQGAIKVEERVPGDPTEYKWYAPGVGVVKVQAKGETLRLEYFTP